MIDELRKKYDIDYNIKIDIKNNNYYFLYNDKAYFFMECTRTIEELNDLIELNEELIRKNINTSRFILNKENNYLTKIRDKTYILLEMSTSLEEEYNIIDIINLSNKLIVQSKNSILYRNIWNELWSKKIDYIEYQVKEMGREKDIILNSINYYIGLTENAIYYVNETNKNYKITINEKITLQHKRINFPNLYYDYFNPLNYIIDIEVRDVATYFQSLFFNKSNELEIELNSYFNLKRLSTYGYQLLYARLLYPSYYFDVYEQIMNNQEREEKLIPIIEQSSNYELFLKDIYYRINNITPIMKIDWILKKES